MSHNDMSINAFKMLSEGLALNTRLTDFFFTHNNLADAAEGGIALINAMKNKTELKSLALNSCNLTSELLAELDESITAFQLSSIFQNNESSVEKVY